jgi:hypothetical protein
MRDFGEVAATHATRPGGNQDGGDSALTSVAKKMRQKESGALGGKCKDLSVAHRRALRRGNVF